MGDKELSAIEDEMEATREHLAETIDQLLFRASPKTIARREVRAVKGVFVEPDGHPRPGNIAKVVGGVVGVVAVFALVRKIVR